MMAKRIKEKRTELNLTQEELAARLGLQKSAIAKYENGRVKNIKRSTIQKMAEIFDCSPAWLMGMDDELTDIEMKTVLQAESDIEYFNKYKSLAPAQKKIIDDLIDQFLKTHE